MEGKVKAERGKRRKTERMKKRKEGRSGRRKDGQRQKLFKCFKDANILKTSFSYCQNFQNKADINV